MPSEPDWLKYTGFTSMRELALEAMRNDSTLRAARLSQAEKGIQRMRATARLDLAKRVKTRPNYAEPSEDDDDDQCEEEEGDKTDADFVVEDGSNEAMPDADYVPGAESEGGSPKSTSRSEDPEESEDENTHVLQEATQPGLARDIPLPREALPQLQPPVIDTTSTASLWGATTYKIAIRATISRTIIESTAYD
ncbi:unnamed protein product [Clonostachys chloroleuca]|uniref:Uncharacterized protein n=1 Tax=Clonostachys chloroleuca TaxID=1926264 RepID=A0AA35M3D4_9HYPO|nr:unnamed protein product [Clonostachys chloroleuca]